MSEISDEIEVLVQNFKEKHEGLLGEKKRKKRSDFYGNLHQFAFWEVPIEEIEEDKLETSKLEETKDEIRKNFHHLSGNVDSSDPAEVIAICVDRHNKYHSLLIKYNLFLQRLSLLKNALSASKNAQSINEINNILKREFKKVTANRRKTLSKNGSKTLKRTSDKEVKKRKTKKASEVNEDYKVEKIFETIGGFLKDEVPEVQIFEHIDKNQQIIKNRILWLESEDIKSRGEKLKKERERLSKIIAEHECLKTQLPKITKNDDDFAKDLSDYFKRVSTSIETKIDESRERENIQRTLKENFSRELEEVEKEFDTILMPLREKEKRQVG